MVGIHLVYRDISSKIINLKNRNFYIIKNWIENLCDFCLKIQLIILRLFEANMGSRVSYYVNTYQILQYNCIFHLKGHEAMDLVLLHSQGFHRNFCFKAFFSMSDISFVMKSVLNIRIRPQNCVQQKRNHLEHLL